MDIRFVLILICLSSTRPFTPEEDIDVSANLWEYRHRSEVAEDDRHCSKVLPVPMDLIRRFHAILPYFDKDRANSAFLHKYRATVYGMSESSEVLDKEVAFYAAVITPLLFLQHQKDMWCVLERFHRSIRLYQLSHPAEKRAALKLLQNLRNVNLKVRSFITGLSGPFVPTRSTPHQDSDDEDVLDKNEHRYLKELIKNLG